MATAARLTLAQVLRQRRLAAGLTQAELAERARLSLRAISDIERGLKRPYRDTVARLADALQLSGPERAAFEACARNRQTPLAPGPASPLHDAASTSPSPRVLPPLVARARELALITRHLGAEAPSLLVLMGEPGIGKSRLLAEADTKARTAGWTVLSGGCVRRSGQEPYAPFVGVLARAIGQSSSAKLRRDLAGCSWLVRLVPELADTRAVPVPQWSLPPEQEQRFVFDAVGRYLANIAGPRGILLLLDDLQWAGQDALDLLASLVRTAAVATPDPLDDAHDDAHPDAASARSSGRLPLRLIVACRDTEIRAEDPFAVLLTDLARDGLAASADLAPLSGAEASELARALLGGAQRGETETQAYATLASQLAERTGGRPYFVVSCAQAMRAARAQRTSQEVSDALEIPWNVSASIRQRIAMLPRAAQNLLDVAAVAGRHAARALMAQVAAHLNISESDFLAALEATDRARLLCEAGADGYEFAHDLVREVVAADLGAARRASLHRRIGEVLERLPEHKRQPAELAWHFLEAGEAARALPYTLLAGDQAEAVYANAEAERHYRTAVSLARALGDRTREGEALGRLGTLFCTVGRYDWAPEMLEQAAESYRAAGGPAAVPLRTTVLLAQTYGRVGQPEQGLAHLTPVLESPRFASEHERSREHAVLQAAGADLYYHSGRYRDQLAAAERAAELARMVGDIGTLAQVEDFRGVALYLLGRWEESLLALQDAAKFAEAANDLWTWSHALRHIADAYEQDGQMSEAAAAIERGLKLVERQGHVSHIAIMVYRRGVNAFYRGLTAETRVWYERAVGLWQQMTLLWTYPYAPLASGHIRMVTGDWETGAADLERAIALSAQSRNVHVLRTAHRELGEGYLIRGHAEAARSQLEPLVTAPDRQGENDITPLMLLLAWAYIELGDEPQASALLARAAAQAEAQHHQLALVDILRVRGVLAVKQGHWQEAKAALDDDVERTRAMPYPYAEAKALYVYGQLYAAQGELEQAREKYEQALAICDRLGEGLYRPHIARALNHTLRV